MSSMSDWAEKEVRLAIKKEEQNSNSKDKNLLEYASGCYESALKAFRSLMNDKHSLCSFSLTKDILMRLINGLPLTPIEDTPDVWMFSHLYTGERYGKAYQCTRMPSLFKHVDVDGTVSYHDTERYYAVDSFSKNRGSFQGCNVQKILDEYFPIKMPYCPSIEKYKVEVRTFLSGEGDEDKEFDTIFFDDIIQPDGSTLLIVRCFKCDGADGLEEIFSEEATGRLLRYHAKKVAKEIDEFVAANQTGEKITDERSGEEDPD